MRIRARRRQSSRRIALDFPFCFFDRGGEGKDRFYALPMFVMIADAFNLPSGPRRIPDQCRSGALLWRAPFSSGEATRP